MGQIKQIISHLEDKILEMRAQTKTLKKSRYPTRFISIDEKNTYLGVILILGRKEGKRECI